MHTIEIQQGTSPQKADQQRPFCQSDAHGFQNVFSLNWAFLLLKVYNGTFIVGVQSGYTEASGTRILHYGQIFLETSRTQVLLRGVQTVSQAQDSVHGRDAEMQELSSGPRAVCVFAVERESVERVCWINLM
jgi:hypothetical protein